MRLPLVDNAVPDVLLLELADEKGLVLLLLQLPTVQVHLLQLLSAVVQLLLRHVVLHGLQLARTEPCQLIVVPLEDLDLLLKLLLAFGLETALDGFFLLALLVLIVELHGLLLLVPLLLALFDFSPLERVALELGLELRLLLLMPFVTLLVHLRSQVLQRLLQLPLL